MQQVDEKCSNSRDGRDTDKPTYRRSNRRPKKIPGKGNKSITFLNNVVRKVAIQAVPEDGWMEGEGRRYRDLHIILSQISLKACILVREGGSGITC